MICRRVATPPGVVVSGTDSNGRVDALRSPGRAGRVQHVGARDAVLVERFGRLRGDSDLVRLVPVDRAVEHQAHVDTGGVGDDLRRLVGLVLGCDEDLGLAVVDDVLATRCRSSGWNTPCRSRRRSDSPRGSRSSDRGSPCRWRRGRPGWTPTDRSNRLNRLAAASSSAKVWVKPEPAMMRAGLSGCVATNAPGYTTANVARRYLAGVDPAVQTICRPRSTEPRPTGTSISPVALVASTIDHNADVGSIIVGLDKVADTCPASFDGIVDTLFAVRIVRRRRRRLSRSAQLVAPRGAGAAHGHADHASASWQWRSASVSTCRSAASACPDTS